MNDHIHLAAEYDQTPSRELPHSVEAEQAILGGLLNEPRAWVRVSDLVVESDFFRADHRLIFKAIARLLEEGGRLMSSRHRRLWNVQVSSRMQVAWPI